MEFSEVLTARRSTRKFTDDKVSAEQINEMLKAAIAAPNACNMQSWHFYVITDPSVKTRLAEEKTLAEWATTAPVIFVVCTAPDAIVKRFSERAELFTIQDTACAIENLLLCAADMGLGGCFMGAFDHDKCREIVGIPEKYKPIAMVPVGKPAEILPPRPRNTLESVVTFVGDPGDANAEAKALEYRRYEVKNCSVPGAVFENACLDGAIFKNCSMKDVKFEDCQLTISDSRS